MIGILNYGVGNLQSVYNAFAFLEEKVFFINIEDDFKKASAIIIPGVGHFRQGVNNIHEFGLNELLHLYVKEKKLPCLGICLGMQLLAELGMEGGESRGFGWFPATVERLDFGDRSFDLRIPHVGWNEIEIVKSDSPLFSGMTRPTFYFVHSYFVNFNGDGERYITSFTNYGRKITASIERENIYAVQFHPEKSQQDGIKLLRNFVKVVKDA